MEATFALLGKDLFGLGAGGLGIIFTYVGIVIAVVQGGLIGRLNTRFGERKLAVSGTGLMAVSLLLPPLMPTLSSPWSSSASSPRPGLRRRPFQPPGA